MADLNTLAQNDLSAVKEFSKEVKRSLKDKVVEIKLFGSKVKGTDDQGSDIDVLILVKELTWRQKDKIFEITADVNLKYDVLISPIIIDNDKYNSLINQKTEFFKETNKKGITI